MNTLSLPIMTYRLIGFERKIGTLAEHLAKLLERDVAGYPPSDPNPEERANRSWCITVRRIIREIEATGYSTKQLNRDLVRAGFAGSRWSAILQAIADVIDQGVCDDHWGDFSGGSLAGG